MIFCGMLDLCRIIFGIVVDLFRPRAAVPRDMAAGFRTMHKGTADLHGGSAERQRRHDPARVRYACPYRKSNPHVLMVQSTKHRPHFDAPGTLDVPPNGCILAQR